MFIVTLKNNNIATEIHGHKDKLKSGNVVKGINTIDSFNFSMLRNNPGFNLVYDFTTLVDVYNTNKNRYEFQGRVLYTSPEMAENGLIKKEVTCESFLGYLCDSQQLYVEERNWSIRSFLGKVITCHNSQVEASKRFVVRNVTVTASNNNIYTGIQRENTWETIKKKLIDVLGGEIRFEVQGDTIYLDYLDKIGSTKTTEIALSKNMKSIVQEKDPSAYITRLIPLGAKLSEDSEDRLTIESVNDGSIYLDDAQAISYYGIHVGYKEYDDVTDPSNLLSKARKWLTENNKVKIKYSITALDLSLLGLDIDDFDVCNYHPIKNSLLDIDDVGRIIKKNIDICEEVKSTIEVGENFKTLTELQAEQEKRISLLVNTVGKIQGNYVTNQAVAERLLEERAYTESLINQLPDEILLQVSGEYVKTTNFNEYKQSTAAELSLKISKDDNSQIISMINASADVITLKSNRLKISSDNFSLTEDGTLTATNADITGNITATSLTIAEGATINGTLVAKQIQDEYFNANGNYSRLDLTYQSFFTMCKRGNEYYSLSILPTYTEIKRTTGEGSTLEKQGGGQIKINDDYQFELYTLSGYLKGKWTSQYDVSVTSDRELKHDIEALCDNYSELFDRLTPVRFKYNDDESDQYHIGFVAQDIEESLTESKLSTQDFAALVNTNNKYSLRYGEFVALCVNEIQKLKKRIIDLENKGGTVYE